MKEVELEAVGIFTYPRPKPVDGWAARSVIFQDELFLWNPKMK